MLEANAKIISALSSLNIPVSWLEYKGTAKEYIVFNHSSNLVVEYGDDKDLLDEEIVQVHYFTAKNPVSTLRTLRTNLRNAGFTILETITMKDSPLDNRDTGLIHCMVKVSILSGDFN